MLNNFVGNLKNHPLSLNVNQQLQNNQNRTFSAVQQPTKEDSFIHDFGDRSGFSCFDTNRYPMQTNKKKPQKKVSVNTQSNNKNIPRPAKQFSLPKNIQKSGSQILFKLPMSPINKDRSIQVDTGLFIKELINAIPGKKDIPQTSHIRCKTDSNVNNKLLPQQNYKIQKQTNYLKTKKQQEQIGIKSFQTLSSVLIKQIQTNQQKTTVDLEKKMLTQPQGSQSRQALYTLLQKIRNTK